MRATGVFESLWCVQSIFIRWTLGRGWDAVNINIRQVWLFLDCSLRNVPVLWERIWGRKARLGPQWRLCFQVLLPEHWNTSCEKRHRPDWESPKNESIWKVKYAWCFLPCGWFFRHSVHIYCKCIIRVDSGMKVM